MQLFINNWSAALTAQALASATQLSVDPAQAAKLIGLGAGDHYLLTLAAVDGAGVETAWEVVKVTASSAGMLTVQRAQEGTIARDWPSASTISARLTAGAVGELFARPAQPGVPPGGSTGQVLSKASGDNFNVAWTALPAAQPGVPPGGSTGQVLSKASADNFNVAWTTPAGGGGGASLPVVQTFTGTKALALSDINAHNVSQDATAQTVTIPAQSSVAWTANAEIRIERGNTGALTISADFGVTVNGALAGQFAAGARYSVATLTRTGTDKWTLVSVAPLVALQ